MSRKLLSILCFIAIFLSIIEAILQLCIGLEWGWGGGDFGTFSGILIFCSIILIICYFSFKKIRNPIGFGTLVGFFIGVLMSLILFLLAIVPTFLYAVFEIGNSDIRYLWQYMVPLICTAPLIMGGTVIGLIVSFVKKIIKS